MKTIILMITVLLYTLSFAQKPIDLKSMKGLPKLELKNELQKFKVTTTHYNGDIFGHLFNKQQIYGQYTRGFDDDSVRWNNVTFAQSNTPDRNAEFTQKTPINYMENFTYIPGEDMIKAEKFNSFREYSAFTKNLVWDMLAIESFSWAYYDKLKLNVPFSDPNMNGKVDLAGQGFFENKDIQLTWTGISERNGETCATIEYRTLNNPLEVTADGMDMKGRSHYWGTIWLSLEDKQIEHAVLFEDVILEMLLPGQSQKSIMNATREISFERML